MPRIAVAFCAGAAALFALPSLWTWPALAALAVAALVAARRLPGVAAALAGFAWAQALAADALSTAWPCARDRETVEIRGRIAGPALERDGRIDFDLELLPALDAAAG